MKANYTHLLCRIALASFLGLPALSPVYPRQSAEGLPGEGNAVGTQTDASWYVEAGSSARKDVLAEADATALVADAADASTDVSVGAGASVDASTDTAALEIRERVYVQTDKDFYLAGETLWLKMYVTDPSGRPIDFSRIGYAELVGAKGAEVQVKLALAEGSGWGKLVVPPTLPSGCYRLTGYTRHMRNEGEDVYFTKTIRVYNAWTTSPDDRIEEVPAPGTREALETQGSLSTLPSPAAAPLRITTDRATYSTRSRIHIQLEDLPAGADLALSVVRIDSLPPGEPSGLGYWHTQLARLPRLPLADTYLPEYEGAIVTGRILPATGTGESTGAKPAEAAPLPQGFSATLAVPGDRPRLFDGQLDTAGRVNFYTDALCGVHEVVAVAESPGAAAYRIDLEAGFASHTPVEMPPLKLYKRNEAALLAHSMALQSQYLFAGDSLPAAAPGGESPGSQAQQKAVEAFGYAPRFVPTRSYRLDDYVRFRTVEQTFTEFILGVLIRKIGNQPRFCVRKEEKQGFNDGNTLVLLDGIPLADHQILLDYNPYRLSRIDIYQGTYVFGNRMYEGMIAFYTPRHRFPDLRLPGGMQLLDYKGTAAVESLEGAAYPTDSLRASRLPDFRHTLYWNPSLKNVASSLELDCYASDFEGSYLITVEGLSPEGQPVWGRQTIYIKE